MPGAAGRIAVLHPERLPDRLRGTSATAVRPLNSLKHQSLQPQVLADRRRNRGSTERRTFYAHVATIQPQCAVNMTQRKFPSCTRLRCRPERRRVTAVDSETETVDVFNWITAGLRYHDHSVGVTSVTRRCSRVSWSLLRSVISGLIQAVARPSRKLAVACSTPSTLTRMS